MEKDVVFVDWCTFCDIELLVSSSPSSIGCTSLLNLLLDSRLWLIEYPVSINLLNKYKHDVHYTRATIVTARGRPEGKEEIHSMVQS